MTQYQIQGKNKVSLSQNDFKGMGGEASIFVKGSTAYKIYTERSKMIPTAKIQELSVLTPHNIINPQDVILNGRNQPVGYTMEAIPESYVLCQLFPKAFKDRNHLDSQKILSLVQKIQEGIQFCHKRQILLVDINEMNFLVDKYFTETYFIDVDSYKTPHFNPTALMDSIRDRHASPSNFNQGTDWFSFSCVAFQLFAGVHPYKGKHDKYKTLDERMQKNISVLNPAVTVPSSVASWNTIPSGYMQWFQAVLNDGKRIEPPKNAQAVIIITTTQKPIVGSNQFTISEVFTLEGKILSYNKEITLTTEGIYQNSRKIFDIPGAIITTPKLLHTIQYHISNRNLYLFDLTTKQSISCTQAATKIMSTDNRIYFQQGTNILEIEWAEGESMHALPSVVGTVAENATQLFQGVAIQSLLKSTFVSLFPKSGTCYEVRAKELDEYQIIDAKYESQVLIVTASKGGKYDKFIFRFDEYFQYDLRKQEDITTYGVNFTVLSHELCLHINDNDELEIFSSRKDSSGLKILKDPAIDSSCLLMNDGTQALFARDSTLYKFSMR